MFFPLSICFSPSAKPSSAPLSPLSPPKSKFLFVAQVFRLVLIVCSSVESLAGQFLLVTLPLLGVLDHSQSQQCSVAAA